MNMFRKIYADYLNKCGFMSYGFKFFVAVTLTFIMAACDDDGPDSEPDQEPTSTFKLHIGEENVVQIDIEAPDCYPPMYEAILVMEDLPADEKIIYMGAVYSTENQEPDKSDCTTIYDYSNFELFQNWDWKKEPLYWRCISLFHPLPGTAYYVRGYVQTDKGEYYSNTIEIRSGLTNLIPEDPNAYKIPVVFHIFPDAEGNYPVKDWMVKEQLEYANNVFGNYYNIPGQIETGVRFVAATHAPDGTKLEIPGIVHETEAVEVDFQNVKMADKYVWDMEHALNVWICPIKNADDYENEYNILGGFTSYPFFDTDEMLEGCNEFDQSGIVTGIYLNATAMTLANDVMAFAHEAGHFLALEHVFAPKGDFCDDTQWYDYTAYRATMESGIHFNRTSRAVDVFWSDNIMDYEYGFMTGFTPDQLKRIQYTLQHAYFIPGEAGKKEPASRSLKSPRRFVGNPIR